VDSGLPDVAEQRIGIPEMSATFAERYHGFRKKGIFLDLPAETSEMRVDTAGTGKAGRMTADG
jgi:hypothetical protein